MCVSCISFNPMHVHAECCAACCTLTISAFLSLCVCSCVRVCVCACVRVCVCACVCACVRVGLWVCGMEWSRRSKSFDCIMQHHLRADPAPDEHHLLPEGMLFGIDIGLSRLYGVCCSVLQCVVVCCSALRH